MNSFNKLYNLILESIISQNKISRAILLSDRQDHQVIQNYLNNLASIDALHNKIADFLAKFFASEELEDCKDPKIEQIITILRRQPNIDIQKKYTLDQFLKENKKYIERQQNKKASQNLISTIDNHIKEFSQKFVDTKVDGGLIIYKVEDSYEAMKVVRQIVDTEWGIDANPWCLIAREDTDDNDENMEQAWYYWKQYSAYPKHIAFQGGHLLAFCANNQKETAWWDREDNGNECIILNNGHEYYTKEYQWSEQEKRVKQEAALTEFKQKYQLRYNQKTDRYDYNNSIIIKDDYIINGHFPVKFGVINGNFTCEGCESLKTLQGAPTEVRGYFNCYDCKSLTSLKGSPKKVISYICGGNHNITTFQGCPEFVNHLFRCKDMFELDNIDYLPKVFKKLEITGCSKLSKKDKKDLFLLRYKDRLVYNQQTDRYDNLDDQYGENIRVYDSDLIDGHFPVKFGVMKNGFVCSNCPTLTSLVGGPTEVDHVFNCAYTSIKTLEGAPQTLGNYTSFECYNCSELESLQGAPYYAQYFICSDNPKLKSLKGSPKQIGREFKCYRCNSLKSLQGNFADDCQFELNACSCQNLTSLKGAPKGARILVKNCKNLKITKEDIQQIRQIVEI